MSRDDAFVIASEDARRFVQGIDFNAFEVSRLHQNAVIRSLEVIGEAAGKLSPEFTASYPDLPWRNIINMRHRLIHAYNEVRLDIVWSVTQNDLPQLIATLKPVVPHGEQG